VDFTLDSAAAAVADVADEAFARLTPEWPEKFADPVGGFDHDAWRAVVGAGLTALPLPEGLGGDEVGVHALTPLVSRAGRAGAVTPLVGSLTSATLLAAAPEAAAVWAESLTDGRWHAVALGEPGRALGEPCRVRLTGEAGGDRSLDGITTGVLHADGAAALLVGTDSGAVIVAADTPGVRLVRTTSSSGWGEYTVTFESVRIPARDVLTDDARPLIDVYRALLCSYADGLMAGAVAMTAEHVSTRTQFGKPIAGFQAVGQQLADVFVIARGEDLAVTAGAWRLSEGLDAAQDLAVATYWMAAELPATLRTMTHLHGGIGVDVTYPLHRYFSIAKDLARLAGGAEATLDVLAGIAAGDLVEEAI